MSKKQSNRKLSENSNAIEYAKNFIIAFNNKIVTESKDISRVFEHRMKHGGFQVFQNGAIIFDDSVTIPLKKLIFQCSKFFSVNQFHEKTIQKLSIEKAIEEFFDKKGIEKATKDLLDYIQEKMEVIYQVVLPNYIFRFGKNVDEIKIGRVTAIKAEAFYKNQNAKEENIKLYTDDKYNFIVRDNGRIEISFPTDILWIVDVIATKENTQEESLWLIDVAVSLLRLTESIEWSGIFPSLGKIEALPITTPVHYYNLILLKNNKVDASGEYSVPPWYEINQAVYDVINSDNFINKASILFNPPKNTLAEKVYRGLGWMTRARRAMDKSERFLYFFTALESILTSNDKAAPVTETIARNAAVLSTNEIEERLRVSRDIKNLYKLRSQLVHGGNRDIIWGNVNYLQKITEHIFMRVVNDIELTQTYKNFCNDLKNCSYGLPYE